MSWLDQLETGGETWVKEIKKKSLLNDWGSQGPS